MYVMRSSALINIIQDVVALDTAVGTVRTAEPPVSWLSPHYTAVPLLAAILAPVSIIIICLHLNCVSVFR